MELQLDTSSEGQECLVRIKRGDKNPCIFLPKQFNPIENIVDEIALYFFLYFFMFGIGKIKIRKAGAKRPDYGLF